MQEAEFQHEGTIAAAGVTENGAAYEVDQCTLFSFRQKEMIIHLGVSEAIPVFPVEDEQHRSAPGQILTRRDVDFIFLTARFKNDFEAISKVLSLITAAEQNQFGLKHQELSMACLVPHSRRICAENNMHSEEDCVAAKLVQADIFVRKAQFRSAGYGLGLSLGLKTTRRTWSIDLPIFWVHHLKNGLKKALNWIKPAPTIRAS